MHRIPFTSVAGTQARAVLPQARIIASSAHAGSARPLRPSRARIDPDRVVGVACALLFPLALWFAHTS